MEKKGKEGYDREQMDSSPVRRNNPDKRERSQNDSNPGDC